VEMQQTFQDDSRETETRTLFDLEAVPGRSETDAVLTLDSGQRINFELKSTSKESVTTVRDFGPDHVAKWEDKHWLISFYDKRAESPSYYLYGSPKMMDGWIQEKLEYINPDFNSANIAADRIQITDLDIILGNKEFYTYEDAKKLHKKQYTSAEYKAKLDLPNGYSKIRMLDIYKDRIRYLIKRGSTLNNPHIPRSYFDDWNTRIDSDYPNRLRQLVIESLT